MLRTVTRVVAGLSVSVALLVATASALRAECVSPEWDPNEIVCSSCGETGCCYTHWHGNQLISTWCVPYPE